MKAVALHGPGISASRSKLLDLKQKFDPNNVVIFEEGTSAADILTSLQSVPMFSGDRLIIAENPPEDLLSNFTLSALPFTLILWFDHEIDVKKWPGFEVMFFPEAKEITAFPFLDMLAAKSKNAYLEIDKLKKAGFDTQYIITMIFYLLRSLIYQPQKAHPFAKQKAQQQSKNFTQNEIIALYKFILETDFKIKKGLLETDQAEFLLVSRFFDLFQH